MIRTIHVKAIQRCSSSTTGMCSTTRSSYYPKTATIATTASTKTNTYNQLHQHVSKFSTTSTSSSSSPSLITTSSYYNHANNHFSSSSSPSMNFSSMSSSPKEENENILIIPPNLQFDRRAVSTPIYGLDKLTIDDDDDDDNDSSNDDVVNDEDTLNVSSVEEESSNNNESSIINDKNLNDNESTSTVKELLKNDDYHNDKLITNEDTIYSLQNKPEPLYVIPLPQRLHVTVHDFIDTNQQPSGTIHLSPYLFGQDPIRTDILHRCVIYQRNKKRGRRNNGARTKTISTKSGSGKKMRNQKGGGVARAGHKRAAHWRGGAKAHGPKGNDQNYETKLNKKVRMMGIRMALSQKLKEGNLIIVNSFEGLDSYKTKTLASLLDRVGDIGGRYGCTAYVIDHVPEDEEENDDGTLKGVNGVHINLQVASGNIWKTKVRNQKFVNVFDVLKYEKMVISLSALEALEERYAEN